MPPRLRRLDPDGHITFERDTEVAAIKAAAAGLGVAVMCESGCALDLVAWRLPPDYPEFLSELQRLAAIEICPVFLWGSHTPFVRAADVYRHLIQGHVYENRFSWPKYWKSCSENDAHALFVTLCGLECATGKGIYRTLKTQLSTSVVFSAGPGRWLASRRVDRSHGVALPPALQRHALAHGCTRRAGRPHDPPGTGARCRVSRATDGQAGVGRVAAA